MLESREESKTRRIVEDTTRRIENLFEAGLLLRSDFVELPISYLISHMVLRELECLEK